MDIRKFRAIIYYSIILFLVQMGRDILANEEDNDIPRREMISLLNEKIFDRPIQLIWGRDPFFKKPGHVEVLENDEEIPELSAIFYSPENPQAIINEKLIGLNGIVNGRKIIQIGKNYVLLEKGTSVIEIQLPFMPEQGSKMEIKEVQP